MMHDYIKYKVPLVNNILQHDSALLLCGSHVKHKYWLGTMQGSALQYNSTIFYIISFTLLLSKGSFPFFFIASKTHIAHFVF